MGFKCPPPKPARRPNYRGLGQLGRLNRRGQRRRPRFHVYGLGLLGPRRSGFHVRYQAGLGRLPERRDEAMERQPKP